MAKGKSAVLDEMEARVAAAEAAEQENATVFNEALAADVAEAVDAGSELARPEDVSFAYTMTMADMKMPKLKIVQGLSKILKDPDANARLGQWYIDPPGLVLGNQITVVPLNWFKTRSLYVKDVGVMCRSSDLFNGVGTPGGTCGFLNSAGKYVEVCPMSKWTKSPDGSKNIPPPCPISFHYTVLVIDWEGKPADADPPVALISFRSTAMPVAEGWNTAKALRVGISGPWHTFTYKLRTKEGKTHYSPVVNPSEKTPQEYLEYAADLASSLDANRQAAAMEASGDNE